MRKNLFFRGLFWAAVAIMMAFDLVVAVVGASYNSYNKSFDFSSGFSVISSLFGNILNLIFLLVGLGVLAGIYWGVRHLSSKRKQHDLVAFLVILALLGGGVIGFGWIHLSMTLIIPLCVFVFVTAQTWVVAYVVKRIFANNSWRK